MAEEKKDYKADIPDASETADTKDAAPEAADAKEANADAEANAREVTDEIDEGTNPTGDDGEASDAKADDTESSESDDAGEDAEAENAEDAGADAGTVNAKDDISADNKDSAGGKSEKSGFFKKKKDKRDEQIEELNDKLRRQMAEFDNFRKRSEKEKSQMFDMGARTIIEKILPVVDNFERGFTMVDEADKDNAFVTGMDKVYKQLMTELDAIGVKAIETEGCEFDPNLHNAVMQVESEELESGMIAQELQKGYKYKDTVVRHSMVSVVQ